MMNTETKATKNTVAGDKIKMRGGMMRRSMLSDQPLFAARCTVCFNPGAVNRDGYCSGCVATFGDAPYIGSSAEELDNEIFLDGIIKLKRNRS